jgi:hypothetical protein
VDFYFRFFWSGIFCWGWDDGDGGSSEAAGFVGIEAVIADYLLACGWDVFDGGSEEVGGFEDLEVAFGVPTAAGSVDDGFGVGVLVIFWREKGARRRYSARRRPSVS